MRTKVMHPAPQFERRPAGAMIVDGQEVAHTLQCPHCGGHFVSMCGSGQMRGWCAQCNKMTCGKICCVVCVPHEIQLQYTEANSRNDVVALAKLVFCYPYLVEMKHLVANPF